MREVSREVDGVETVMEKEAVELDGDEVSDKVEGAGDVAGEMVGFSGDADMAGEMGGVGVVAGGVNAESRAMPEKKS
jgi:predicted porin